MILNYPVIFGRKPQPQANQVAASTLTAPPPSAQVLARLRYPPYPPKTHNSLPEDTKTWYGATKWQHLVELGTP